MIPRTTTALLAVITALYTQETLAATSSYCPNDSKDVCFRWAVPESSASSGSGNIYFRMEAPTSYQWIALGTGSQMRGSDMFLIYQDGDGNVTPSTRTGTGHVMPEYTERDDVELLAGSGISNGNMVANIKCGACDGLDLTDSNSWIAAWKSGDSLDSTSPSERISEHDEEDGFSVDFAQAAISSDSNPFLTTSSDGGSSSDTGSNSDNTGSGVVSSKSSDNTDAILRAHGIIMSIVFLAGYPLGAVLMPIVGKWFIHAGWQTVVFMGMWAGLALGVIVGNRENKSYSEAHLGLGVAVCALMGLQPILGWLHHAHYVKHQTQGVYSYVHVWFGRLLMIIGVINGGLGLKLASSGNAYIIAYSVVAGVAFALYAAVALIWGLRKKKQPQQEKQVPVSPQTSGSSARRV